MNTELDYTIRAPEEQEKREGHVAFLRSQPRVWEYVHMRQMYYGWSLPDGTEATFDELGAQGWELISVAQAEHESLTAYFKRPKAAFGGEE